MRCPPLVWLVMYLSVEAKGKGYPGGEMKPRTLTQSFVNHRDSPTKASEPCLNLEEAICITSRLTEPTQPSSPVPRPDYIHFLIFHFHSPVSRNPPLRSGHFTSLINVYLLVRQISPSFLTIKTHFTFLPIIFSSLINLYLLVRQIST